MNPMNDGSMKGAQDAVTNSQRVMAYVTMKRLERRETPRVWLQGNNPARAGFVPGARFQVEHGPKHVALKLSDDGMHLVSRKEVETKRDGPKLIPVIDLNSWEDLGVLAPYQQIRVVYTESAILILPLESDLRKADRDRRLLDGARTGAQVEVGAVCFGGGVLDGTLHKAFEEEQCSTHLAFANELREELLEHAMDKNPSIAPDTIIIAAPLQEMAFDERLMARLPKVDLLTAGLPCSGASVAGRAKRKLEHPEAHPLVGHLVVPCLAVVARVNPLLYVLENVPSYASTASADILRNTLRDLGYEVHEREFLATDFGDLEARKRWVLVANAPAIEVDLEQVQPEPFRVRQLSEVFDLPEVVASRWSPMEGLKAKEQRDLAEGKNFKMQVFTGSESQIGTLTKGMTKNRSTDPKIQHPTDPELLRVPTAAEHARIKGIPEAWIDDLSEMAAHELLGQGICAAPFKALFKYLARQIKQARQRALQGATAVQAFVCAKTGQQALIAA